MAKKILTSKYCNEIISHQPIESFPSVTIEPDTVNNLNLTTSTNFEHKASDIVSKKFTHLEKTIQNIKLDVELKSNIKLHLRKFELMIHSLNHICI